MGKMLVVSIFSLAVCWGVSRYFNIGATAFSVGGMPISGTMLLFTGMVFVGYRLAKK